MKQNSSLCIWPEAFYGLQFSGHNSESISSLTDNLTQVIGLLNIVSAVSQSDFLSKTVRPLNKQSRKFVAKRGKAILNWSDRAGVDGKYPTTGKFWFHH